MVGLKRRTPHKTESAAHRSAPIRVLDWLAEQQMRHSHHVISRHLPKATMTGVAQPSSENERSSTKPWDR